MNFLKNILEFKLISGLTWGMQNFLTMEFYRKICNKCYWDNVYNREHSMFKNTLLIIISILPALFISFFYLPTDPANSSNAASTIRSVKFHLLIRLKLAFVIETVANKIINIPSFSIVLSRLPALKGDLFTSYSVLRI